MFCAQVKHCAILIRAILIRARIRPHHHKWEYYKKSHDYFVTPEKYVPFFVKLEQKCNRHGYVTKIRTEQRWWAQKAIEYYGQPQFKWSVRWIKWCIVHKGIERALSKYDHLLFYVDWKACAKLLRASRYTFIDTFRNVIWIKIIHFVQNWVIRSMV